MEEFFNNIISNMWNTGFSEMSERPLSYDIIEDSVGRASAFFHFEHPVEIKQGHNMTTSISNTNTYSDEFLFYNREQLENMGITGQDGLDLVMAHEGTRLMLQDMDMGLNSYQEELCCDYMVGIRAGLNDIDMSQVESYLMGDDYTGINGKSRFDAIAEGMDFAHDYMDSHHDSPKFMDCFEQFKESQANSSAEIAELMDEQYEVECTMQHYKDLLSNGSDGFSSVEEYEDAIRRYFTASAEHALLSNQISFKSRESMLPYEDYSKSIYIIEHPELNPFGVYIMYHSNIVNPVENYQKPDLPDDFLDRDPKEGTKLLQNACDSMCDATGIRHIKVYLTDSKIITDNAAHHPGGFLFTYVDDTLYLNRDYARGCIQHFGNTDSLLVDMAHEIGHAVNMVHCGRLDRKSDETLADMFSTILTSMMGIDIEVSREWNMWKYNGAGSDEYKSSEGRWDIEAAGKYWTELSTIKAYIAAIEDPHFRELVYNYKADSVEEVYDMAKKELDFQINEAGGSKDNLMKFIDGLKKYMLITRI